MDSLRIVQRKSVLPEVLTESSYDEGDQDIALE